MQAPPLNPVALGRFLTEPEVGAVVGALVRRPLPGRQVADATGIPVARCLRILRGLQRLGLVEAAEVVVDARGRAREVFASRLDRLHLSIEGGRMRIRLALPEGMVGSRARP